jgi:mercuric ion binding protein
MKKVLLFPVLAALALAASVQAADVTAKITDVHLCCKNCVTGVEKAVGKVDGVKVDADKDAGSVTLTAADKGALQKATDALLEAGYYGKCADGTVKIRAKRNAKDETVKSVKISGVHICCGKCEKAVDKAVKSVSGVTGDTAKKDADSFEVTGEFNEKAVFDALQKAGFSGKVAK